MTLIDQALFKAFQRREKSAGDQPMFTPGVSQSAAVARSGAAPHQGDQTGRSTRELYLHTPEVRLRGLHHSPPGPRPDPHGEPRHAAAESELTTTQFNQPPLSAAEVATAPADGRSPVDSVMNSLLTYELSIQGPHPDSWQFAAGPSVVAGNSRASLPGASEQALTAAEVSRTETVHFKPAWETDAFRWTEVCRKIRLELQRPIQQAALDLVDDCRGGNRPLVCVTGCRRAEGRTTVAMLLAHALAQAGLKVVLVGADPVNPDLTARLGVAIDSGWNPRLTTVQEVAECCVRSIADGFCFLPLDPQQFSVSDPSTLAMSQLLELLADHFEAVVVDAGRLSSSPNSWPGDLLGAYVVVRDHRQTDSSAVEQLVSLLASAGPCAVRVVDNFAPRQGD